MAGCGRRIEPLEETGEMLLDELSPARLGRLGYFDTGVVADLVNEKKIDGLSDVNDYSDRNGIRVAYEVTDNTLPCRNRPPRLFSGASFTRRNRLP